MHLLQRGCLLRYKQKFTAEQLRTWGEQEKSIPHSASPCGGPSFGEYGSRDLMRFALLDGKGLSCCMGSGLFLFAGGVARE